VVILTVALLLGARPHGGVLGVGVLLLAASFLSAALAGFSSALALLTRRQEIIIAASNFTVTPMIFSSSMLMSHDLMPPWLKTVARINPVEWAVVAARNGYEGRAPGQTAFFLVLSAGFALACGAFATRAFVRYQRSM
jgi:ABC-2 type transport system permease protein